MRERLPHPPNHNHPSPGKKKKKDAGSKHRRAVGIGVVTELTNGGHAQAAGAYYAAGNSCEQAVFAAYAGEMGLSVVKAQQEAPKRKERGALCGGYKAGIAVLLRLISLKAIHDGDVALDGGDQAQNVGLEADGAAKLVVDKPEADGDEIKKDFRELFEEVFGSLKCAEIQAGRKDCLDVITGTARIVEAVIKRYGL